MNIETRFWGAEANYVVRCLQCCGCIGASALVGFRYYDLDEKLTFDQRSNAIDGAAVAFGVPFPAPQGPWRELRPAEPVRQPAPVAKAVGA